VRILPARILGETRGREKSCGESGVPEWYERTGGGAGLECQRGGKPKRKAYVEDTEFTEKRGEGRREDVVMRGQVFG
jgi:hypothetical protein